MDSTDFMQAVEKVRLERRVRIKVSILKNLDKLIDLIDSFSCSSVEQFIEEVDRRLEIDKDEVWWRGRKR